MTLPKTTEAEDLAALKAKIALMSPKEQKAARETCLTFWKQVQDLTGPLSRRTRIFAQKQLALFGRRP